MLVVLGGNANRVGGISGFLWLASVGVSLVRFCTLGTCLLLVVQISEPSPVKSGHL